MSHFKDPYEPINIIECQPRVLNVAQLSKWFQKNRRHCREIKRSSIPRYRCCLENLSSETMMTDVCIYQSKESVNVIVIDFSYLYIFYV